MAQCTIFVLRRGDFYRAFAKRFRPGRYVAVEANPALAEKLRSLPGVEVFNRAVAAADGPVRFGLRENPEASRLAEDADESGVVVAGRTLNSLLAEAGLDRIDLLKVDIEGAELPLILDTPPETLRRIAQITIEYHDFCGIHTPAQVERMIDRLREVGFTGIRFSGNNTNWCFVRADTARANPLRLMVARHFTARLRRLKHASWR